MRTLDIFVRGMILNCSGREMKVSHALVHTLKEVSIIGGISLKVVVKVFAGCGRWSPEGDGTKVGAR